ncbi:hypothetical protein OTU49_013589 [Cherax quadricarinatus]|uniref:Mutator-like transposase domain-containing protein n=1 Tax=Cherax quadricarinatus TaxID=27406 RepID=A0AAW0VUB0_CHEQU
MATPDVATTVPSLTVTISAVTISADPVSAVTSSANPSTSTAEDGEIFVESDSVHDISSATRRVSLLQTLNPVIEENHMVLMERCNFEAIKKCMVCQESFSNKVTFAFDHHHLETLVSTNCTECKHVVLEKPSWYETLNVATGRMICAEMLAGGGHASFIRRNAVCNLPFMTLQTFNKYMSLITNKSIESCNQIHTEAREIATQEYAKVVSVPDQSGFLDIDVTYDGTWHTRDQHSNYGIGATIDAVTELVVDYQIMYKFCFLCISIFVSRTRKFLKKSMNN